jgi:hypothetical protein
MPVLVAACMICNQKSIPYFSASVTAACHNGDIRRQADKKAVPFPLSRKYTDR